MCFVHRGAKNGEIHHEIRQYGKEVNLDVILKSRKKLGKVHRSKRSRLPEAVRTPILNHTPEMRSCIDCYGWTRLTQLLTERAVIAVRHKTPPV